MARDANQQQRSTEIQSGLSRLSSTFRGNYKTVEAMAQVFMREAIVRGIFYPGEKLNQDDIATALGISRIPVRAALRPLEAEGLVRLEPHRGARVSVLTPAEIEELYSIRLLLEGWLLSLAIKKIRSDSIEQLRRSAKAIDAAVDKNARTWHSDEDIDRRRDFYRELYQVAGQPRTLRLVEQLREEVGRYLLLLRAHHNQSSHVDFVELIAAGDRTGARRWLKHHLTQVSSEIQRLLVESANR